MKKGLFITFEGGDGCGKTTQIKLLDECLQSKGYSTLVTREPGSKGLGIKLREILLNYDGEVSPTCESFLFLADRAQHVDCIIKPALEKGVIKIAEIFDGSGHGDAADSVFYATTYLKNFVL